MAGEQIIDLDEFFLPEPPQPQRPVLQARPIGLGALALICVALLGGATPPPAPAFTPVGVITWPTGALADGRPPTLVDGLVITEAGGEIIAYRQDGHQAWRSRLSIDLTEGPRSSSIVAWEDQILVVRSTLRMVAGGIRAMATLSVALDPATGRELWRMDGFPERAGDLVIMTDDRPESSRVRAVYRKLPDGLLWTVPPTRTVIADPATDALLALSDDGFFTEYQLSTGRPRRTARLRVPHLTPPENDIFLGLFQDHVIVRAVRYSGPETTIAALSYERATLAPAPASPLDRFFTVRDCGPVLCASTLEQTSILDRGSLAELWRGDPGESPSWTADGLLLMSDSVRLLDERTGVDRLDTNGWTVAYDPSPSSVYQQSLPMLMTRQVGERTYLARLSARGLEVLGSVPQRLVTCQHLDGLLACRTDINRTSLWRVGGGHR